MASGPVRLSLQLLHETRRVPQYAVALLQSRRSRFPPIPHPGVQDLVGTGDMVPNGDRRDRTESRRAKHQCPATPGNDRVVRELILNDHIADDGRLDRARRLAAAPPNHVRQRLERFDFGLQRLELRLRQSGKIANGHG